VKTTHIIPERTLLDAICTHHEHFVCRAIARHKGANRGWIEGYVLVKTRDKIMSLLDKQGFLAELRDRLPCHELVGSNSPRDLDFWRLAAQNESLVNERSDIDVDDAISIAVFAEIMTESVLAALRGG